MTILSRPNVLFHVVFLANHINSSFVIKDVNLSFIGIKNFEINNPKSLSLMFCPLQISHVNHMSIAKNIFDLILQCLWIKNHLAS
jgi:hypothetical protein